MIIRQEKIEDFSKVYALVKESFSSAEHTDGNEHDLVAALRCSENFIPQLSLVAESDGKIIGHIMFTKALIGEDVELVLAPLAIAQKAQRQGIGSALVREGHRIAGELGYNFCLVTGSEKYYPRFGYLPATDFGVEIPDGLPSENFRIIKLSNTTKSIGGVVKYAKEFYNLM